nr:MAG TPA: Non-structural protein 1 virus, RNA-binding domain, RNA.0A [Caudoviricetes sp.]
MAAFSFQLDCFLKRYNKIFEEVCYNNSVNIGTSPR